MECIGGIGVNAWTRKDGEGKATLTFHTNNIKLNGWYKTSNGNAAAPIATAPGKNGRSNRRFTVLKS